MDLNLIAAGAFFDSTSPTRSSAISCGIFLGTFEYGSDFFSTFPEDFDYEGLISLFITFHCF